MRGLIWVAKGVSIYVYIGTFVLIGIFGYIFYEDFRPSKWIPPAKEHLLVANGTFLPRNFRDCTYNVFCKTSPYKFKLNSGEVINLYCEPHPPKNTCLDLIKNGKRTINISNLNAKINFYSEKDYGYVDGRSYLLFSVISNDLTLLSYEDQVDRISNMSVRSDFYKSVSVERLVKFNFVHIAYLIFSLCFMILMSFKFLPFRGR